MNPLKESFEEVAAWCEKYLESKWGREVGMTFGTLIRIYGRLATLPAKLSVAERAAQSRELRDREEELSVFLALHRIAAQNAKPLEMPRVYPHMTYDPGPYNASAQRPLVEPKSVPTTMPYDLGPQRSIPAAPSMRMTYPWDGGSKNSVLNPRSISANITFDTFRPIESDYRWMAADLLAQNFGQSLDPQTMEQLVGSMVRQWRKFGAASLFLGKVEFVSKLTEQGGGKYQMVTGMAQASLEPDLASMGCPSAVIPDVIASFNLGQEFEFRDRNGIHSLLGYDPKARRIVVRPFHPG